MHATALSSDKQSTHGFAVDSLSLDFSAGRFRVFTIWVLLTGFTTDGDDAGVGAMLFSSTLVEFDPVVACS